MSWTEVFFLVLIIGFLYWLWQTKWKIRKALPVLTKLTPPHLHPPDSETSKQPLEPDLLLPYTLASALTEYYQNSSHPDALLNHPKFVEGVELLNGGGYSNQDLIAYYHGDNAVAACMALEAYARRSSGEDLREKVLANINAVVPSIRYFALRAYRRWAEKRRMQIQPLEEAGGDGKTPYHLLLALSGFAAFAILTA